MVFASNLARRYEPCHRDGRSGCDLFSAELSLGPTGRITQVHGIQLVDRHPGTGAAWFPSVVRRGNGALAMAWNRTSVGGRDIQERNEVILDLGARVPIKGARFPHFDKAKAGLPLSITHYQGDTGRVLRYGALNSSPTTVATNAEDGVFVGSNCMAWQERGGVSPVASCSSTKPTGYCGHPSAPRSGHRLVCSVLRTGDEGLKVMPVGSSGPRYADAKDFMRMGQAFYEDHGFDSGCDLIAETYSSWGDTDDLVLVSVQCFGPLDPTTRQTLASRLFLAHAPPGQTVQEDDVVDLSGAIEEYIGVPYGTLDFVTGDFVTL